MLHYKPILTCNTHTVATSTEQTATSKWPRKRMHIHTYTRTHTHVHTHITLTHIHTTHTHTGATSKKQTATSKWPHKHQAPASTGPRSLHKCHNHQLAPHCNSSNNNDHPPSQTISRHIYAIWRERVTQQRQHPMRGGRRPAAVRGTRSQQTTHRHSV
jgi:hypothetical protein